MAEDSVSPILLEFQCALDLTAHFAFGVAHLDGLSLVIFGSVLDNCYRYGECVTAGGMDASRDTGVASRADES